MYFNAVLNFVPIDIMVLTFVKYSEINLANMEFKSEENITYLHLYCGKRAMLVI